MIKLKSKQDILIKYFRERLSQRAIVREGGIDRKTVKRYIEEYKTKLLEIENSNGEIDKGEII